MDLAKEKATSLRALLTETMPFELPLEMRNDWIYSFLGKRVTRMSRDSLTVQASDALETLLFSFVSAEDPISGRYTRADSYRKRPVALKVPGLSSQWHAPLPFVARRNVAKIRELALPSMRSQLNIAFLYANRSDQLLYQCGRDASSLRFPYSKASIGKRGASEYLSNTTIRDVSVETPGKTSGSYNSYFRYRRFGFVGQFYDSSLWQALESSWSTMERLDISNCFGSIYTHSADWSTTSDHIAKQHLHSKGKPRNLGAELDKIMQSANWGETHGILVGPEFSRIFAEIVLQRISGIIIKRLLEADNSLVHGRDYEFFRYVDDYFVFANSNTTLDRVSSCVKEVLHERRFSVNETKTKRYVTPFTTEISLSKEELRVFLAQALPAHGLVEGLTPGGMRLSLPSFSSRSIGIQLKRSVLELEDQSAALSAVLTQVEKSLLGYYGHCLDSRISERQLIAVIEYAWLFVYDCINQYLLCPSTASSFKLARLIRSFQTCLDASTVPAVLQGPARFVIDAYCQFALDKLVENLVLANNGEIELCNFLSLATAAGISVSQISLIQDEVLRRIKLGIGKGPKQWHNGLLLLLVLYKHVCKDDSYSPAVKDACESALALYSDQLLSETYLPASVKLHAAQEILLFAVLSCPFMDSARKYELLKSEWMEQRIRSVFEVDTASGASVEDWLRRLVGQKIEVGEVLFFDWNLEEFDRLLWEKQPQFVY